MATSPSGETWRGHWQKNDIVAKVLAIRQCTPRISRDFNEEFPKLRFLANFLFAILFLMELNTVNIFFLLQNILTPKCIASNWVLQLASQFGSH